MATTPVSPSVAPGSPQVSHCVSVLTVLRNEASHTLLFLSSWSPALASGYRRGHHPVTAAGPSMASHYFMGIWPLCPFRVIRWKGHKSHVELVMLSLPKPFLTSSLVSGLLPPSSRLATCPQTSEGSRGPAFLAFLLDSFLLSWASLHKLIHGSSSSKQPLRLLAHGVHQQQSGGSGGTPVLSDFRGTEW